MLGVIIREIKTISFPLSFAQQKKQASEARIKHRNLKTDRPLSKTYRIVYRAISVTAVLLLYYLPHTLTWNKCGKLKMRGNVVSFLFINFLCW